MQLGEHMCMCTQKNTQTHTHTHFWSIKYNMSIISWPFYITVHIVKKNISYSFKFVTSESWWHCYWVSYTSVTNTHCIPTNTQMMSFDTDMRKRMNHKLKAQWLSRWMDDVNVNSQVCGLYLLYDEDQGLDSLTT